MNRNKHKAVHIIYSIYKDTLTAVPFSGISGVLNYLVQGLFPAASALILAHLFDAATLAAQDQTAAGSLAFYGVLFVSSYAIVYLLQFIASITINAGIYERCGSYYSQKIAEKTAALPLLAFEDAHVLDLQTRAKDCVSREILSQIYMSSAVFITNGISVVATIGVLTSYSVWFLPISLFSVLPYLIIRILRGREFYRLKAAQAKKSRKVAYLWDLLHDKRAIKEMRIMGFGDYLAQQWDLAKTEVNNELWVQNKKDAESMLFCDGLKIVGYGMSVLLALLLTIHGSISIGIFGACIAAFSSMQEAMKTFLIDIGGMSEKIAFAGDYFRFLDLPEEEPKNRDLDEMRHDIRLSHVDFTYPNTNKPALQDINLTIHAGETVVILGENGSGKTTLSKILLGLYPPTSGEVFCGNVSYAQVDRKTLYRCMSVVQQHFVTYHLTLRENVGLADLAHLDDDTAVLKALHSAGIAELPAKIGGLDTQMGREFGGAELSGGQQQKLAIARGMFPQSAFIVLDEPTSALDPMVESEILRQFVAATKGKTSIIISHRVGLCKLADRIIVMKNGRICEDGNHSQLMELQGEYTKLYTLQEQWYR